MLEELTELGGQGPQALILPPITANWIAQGPGPTQNGQVENVSPNNEVVGAIHTVAAHPSDANIIYVGAVNGGVWKTTNGAASSPTWTPLTDDLPSLSIGALEFDPTDFSYKTLVAGIGRFSSFGQAGGNRSGLLRTTDGGDTWTVLDGGGTLVGVNITGVAARGNIIVASGSFTGVYRSTDSGASFALVSGGSGLPNGRVYDLVGDPTNPAVLYAPVRGTGTDNGIYKSTDTGATWSKVSDAVVDALILEPGAGEKVTQNIELAVGNANNVYVAIINDGQLAGVFRSGDGGATWVEMDLPVTNEAGGDVGTNPRVKPGELAGAQGQIHFSILADPFNSNIVYVGGDRQPRGFNDEGEWPNSLGAKDFTGRLFRGDASLPEGSQWVHLTHSDSLGAAGGGTASSSAPHADSREMVFDANGNIIEGDDGGVYRRTNPRSNTGDWFSINGNLQVTELHDIAYDSNANVLIGGAQDTGTPVQLFPGSTVWTSVSTADGGDVAVDDTSTPGLSTRYSSTQFLNNFVRVIFDANNNPVGGGLVGLQELSFNNLVTQFVTPIALNEIIPTRLLIGGGNSVWESFDQGDTIDVVGFGIQVNSGTANPIAYGGRLNGVPNAEVLYVGAGNEVLVRTTAGGPLLPTLFPGGFVRDIELDDNDWRKAYVIDSSDQIFQTTDTGVNWTNITTDLGSVTNGFRSLEFVPGLFQDSVVIGTNLGVFATSTSVLGEWAEVGPNLPHAPVWDLEYDVVDDVLVAGTLGRGAWLLDNANVTINPFDLPDFVGDFFDVNQAAVDTGQVVDVDYRIRNADIEDSAPFLVDFYISKDATIATDDFFLGQENLAGLNGGATTSNLAKSLQLPATENSFWDGDGTYYIGIIIDRFDFVLESDESNNSNVASLIDFDSFAVTVLDTQPDLLGTSFDVVQEPRIVGDNIDVDFTIQNASTIGAGPFKVNFYLSSDNVISDSDELLGQFSFASLAGNASQANSIALTLPLDESFYGNANDTYFIGMIVDGEDVVAESDEINNSNRGLLIDQDDVVITIPPIPDLLGTSFDVVQEALIIGDSLDVEFTVQNAAAAAAGPFDVNFYLSSNNLISESDELLGQFSFAALGANTSQANTISLTLPLDEAFFTNANNAYFIGMIVDVEDAIAESNENNNRNLGELVDLDSVLITPPPLPDLLGNSFDVVQAFRIAGDTIDVEFAVRNASVTAAGPFTVNFYLSTDNIIKVSDELLGQFPLAGLGGDATQGNTITLTLPLGETSYGNANDGYFIGMIIDVEGQVAESDENNNRNLGELIDRDSVVVALASSGNNPGLPDTIGAFNPDTQTFFLRNSNDSGNADITPFNLAGGNSVIPITGDWNGDGVDTAGVYNTDTAQFRLINENANGVVEIIFNLGIPGWLPIAGDWNGDGVDTVGVYDANAAIFFLRDSNAGGIVDVTSFNYGVPGWTPIAGDWNGDGTDTVGLYNQATATFFLRNTNNSGVADVPAFNYGLPNWVPFVGDWNGDQIDTVGVHNPGTATSFLRNSNDSGVADIPAFNFGIPNWVPLAGKWTDVVQPLLATGGPSGVVSAGPSLTTRDIQLVLNEAVGKWAAAGIDANAISLLSSAEIRIADLPNATLGQVVGNRVYLDTDAAGYGWFVDQTPENDDEYDLLANGQLSAETGPAAAGIDLLAVLTHEFGHLLGLDDHADDLADVMYESLATGRRTLPTAAPVETTSP